MEDNKKVMLVDKATGVMYEAFKIEGGYQLFTLKHDTYKKLKDSTVKRNYRIVKDEPEKSEEPKEVEELSKEKRESLINKIKKILALSENNPSEEEAISAALQAQKLMAKYNIHKNEVTLEEIKDEIDSVRSNQPHDSHLLKWRRLLALIVARSFRCKTYLCGRDVVFRGYKEDAQLALEVYLMLYHVGHTLAKKTESKTRSLTGTAKGIYNSYTAGFLKGVESAFNEQCTALMVIVPKEVEEDYTQFCEEHKAKTSSIRIKSVDSTVYNEGYTEGREAVKSRAIATDKTLSK